MIQLSCLDKYAFHFSLGYLTFVEEHDDALYFMSDNFENNIYFC